MKALVIAHDPTSHAGLIGAHLQRRGFTLSEFVVAPSVENPYSTTPFPDPAAFDLITIFGAVWSVYDEATIGSWVGRERAFLQAADEAGVPILGVCFGLQAMAVAFGGACVRAESPQVGWFPVEVVTDAPIGAGPWFQWHDDRIEPPPEAEVVATDHVGVQVMRLRNHLGVQFHPEVDIEQLRGWLADGGSHEARERGIDPDELLAETAANMPAARANTVVLVDWYLADVARLDPSAAAAR